jgi:hypothetical protein
MAHQDVLQQFARQVNEMCSQDTGWLTCQECMKIFSKTDPQEAGAFALDYWSLEGDVSYSPPGGGAVAVSEALQAAGEAWKECTGMEPPKI